MRRWALLLAMGLAAASCPAQSAQDWMNRMLANENSATSQRGYYMYLNEERSDRTGGHQWRERVAETDWGKVRFLLAEDGKPLSPERAQAERDRLADEAAHPDAFRAQEQSKVDSEAHARQMLGLLPRAFFFDAPQIEGDVVRINYRPNPDYKPATLEERVLHQMSGSVLIDSRLMRMRAVEGHTSEDLNIGFGLASVKAGSNFLTARVHAEGPDWKVGSVHTDIRGKAMFLKLSRQQEVTHTQFHKIPEGTSVGAAVQMVENAGG